MENKQCNTISPEYWRYCQQHRWTEREEPWSRRGWTHDDGEQGEKKNNDERNTPKTNTAVYTSITQRPTIQSVVLCN